MTKGSRYLDLFPGFTIGDVNFKNLKVRYVVGGQGQPLVFLHNGGADLSVWREQLKFFSQTHRVVAFDLLGFGESDKPRRNHDLELCFGALESVLTQLNIQNPILIGNCIGASTAIEYAIRHPDRIKKLVLCSICGGAGFVPKLILLRFIPGLAAAHQLLSLRNLSTEVMFNNDGSSELKKHYEDVLLKRKDLWAARTRTLKGVLSFSKFGRSLDLPENFPQTLLVWGTDNKMIDYKFAEVTRFRLHADLLTIEGGGYLCFYENKEEFNQGVQEFISQNA